MSRKGYECGLAMVWIQCSKKFEALTQDNISVVAYSVYMNLLSDSSKMGRENEKLKSNQGPQARPQRSKLSKRL